MFFIQRLKNNIILSIILSTSFQYEANSERIPTLKKGSVDMNDIDLMLSPFSYF